MWNNNAEGNSEFAAIITSCINLSCRLMKSSFNHMSYESQKSGSSIFLTREHHESPATKQSVQET